MGKDAPYVPGWDCHGLPIEWKVEEQYRKKKQEQGRGADRNEFRPNAATMRRNGSRSSATSSSGSASRAIGTIPTLTMDFEAEAMIANELMKFATNGLLYRGSKPVMWSAVERTALAEAEVEYQEHASPAIWVKFAVSETPSSCPSPQGEKGRRHQPQPAPSPLAGEGGGEGERRPVNIVIWTTTPWTIPGNRAIAFSSKIEYGLYEVTEAPEDNWTRTGERFVLSKRLADDFFQAARAEKWELLEDVDPTGLVAVHPLHKGGFDFKVPLLDGEHVTEDAGTGFVHTAPSHGADDFEIWTANTRQLQADGLDAAVPDMVGPDGYYRKHVPLFGGDEPKRVIDDKGHFGKLDDLRYGNAAVIAALKEAGALAAMNPRYKHDYAHSWRSKAPVIYRNTPQWFIAMDKPHREGQAQPARAGAQLHRRNALRAGARAQSHQRHGRAAPGLGDFAPARLGRADHGLRP